MWKPPCEVRAIRDTRARVCVRTGTRACTYYTLVGRPEQQARPRRRSRVFRLIPRDRAAKRKDDGDEFLEENARRFDNLTATPHRVS